MRSHRSVPASGRTGTNWSTMTRYAMSRSALGGGLAAGLAVGTVVGTPAGAPAGDPTRTGPVPVSTRSVTTQPDQGQVLLSPTELPPGDHPVGQGTGWTGAPAGPADQVRSTDDDTRCRHLFERPWAAAAEWTTSDQVVAGHRTPDGAALRQSLTLLDPADATAALDQLTTQTERCGSFPAALDDGRAVTVRVHRREQLSVGGGGGWSLVLSVTDGTAASAPPLSGYLAVVRTDGLLATVRHLGPIGTVAPADAPAVAAHAVGKVDPAAPLIRPADR